MPRLLITLVIVESPAKCAKIEKFLGPGYKVLASFGHITKINGLKDIDFDNNFKPTYSIIDSKKNNILKLKNAINNSNKVIIATDDDREGEVIGYHLCKVFNLPIETTPRIIFNEITQSAIQYAIENPSLLNMNLVNAAIARQILDIIVGFTISPILWKNITRNSKDGLSAGRCQSPALRLVYDNEQDIIKSPVSFVYNTTGYFTKMNLPYTLNYQFTSHDKMEDFLKDSINFNYLLQNCSNRIITKQPPEPFTTCTLQQNANSILRISPKSTMSICQKLYENGFITYMRTDSKIYSKEFISKASKYIKAQHGIEYVNNNIDLLTEKKSENSKTQEAHEAIRPTDITLTDLDGDYQTKEIKMYKLIWRNAMESCMSEAKYNTITSIIAIDKEYQYKYSCEEVIFPGWKVVDGYEKENPIYKYLSLLKEQVISYNKIAAQITIKDMKSHYTEAKLVKLLEQNGIGRPSTFSSLVDKIQDRGYVKKTNVEGVKKKCYEFELIQDKLSKHHIEKEFGKEKGKLVIQPLGILVLEFLVNNYDNLFNYHYTKLMEDSLDDIAQGKLNWHKLCSDCYEELDRVSRKLEGSERQQYKIDNHHTWMIGKYGPIIKCEQGESITWKKVKNELDFTKLKNGEYQLQDILDTNNNTLRELGYYQDHPMILKNGKFGLYVEWGNNKKSLTYFEKNIDSCDITLEDVIAFIKTPSTIIREISDDLSIRKGKYGPYIFYKTPVMKKPKFFKLKGFQLENSETYETCDDARLIEWIEDKYINN